MLSQLIFFLSIIASHQIMANDAVVQCTSEVQFAKQVGVRVSSGNTKQLLLNGVGRKKVLGFNVFYGALYLERVNSNASSILKSSQLKLGIIHTTLNISRRRLIQVWNQEFERLCGNECESLKPYHDRFLSYARDVARNERLYMIIYPNRFEFVVNNNEVYDPIYSPGYALLMQRLLIGPEAEDKELEEGLLGKVQICRSDRDYLDWLELD